MDEGREEKVSPTGESSDRFQIIVAVLIAVVSVASAGVIWRASLAGSSASSADRQGLIATVKYEAAYAQTVSTLYEEARYASQHARYQARVDMLEALDDDAAHSEAEWVKQIVVNLGSFTLLATDPTYRTADGGLDLDARLGDLRAADADLRDLDPQQDFAAADRYYSESQLLVSAVIVFAVALFFLTLAEITRHRVRVALAVAGVVVFLIGLGGVLVAEAYFAVSRLVV
jgi:hypothetical protein